MYSTPLVSQPSNLKRQEAKNTIPLTTVSTIARGRIKEARHKTPKQACVFLARLSIESISPIHRNGLEAITLEAESSNLEQIGRVSNVLS
jgi:hypothetical protein